MRSEGEVAREGRSRDTGRSSTARLHAGAPEGGCGGGGCTNLYDLAGRDVGGRCKLLQQHHQGPSLLGLLHGTLAAESKARK